VLPLLLLLLQWRVVAASHCADLMQGHIQCCQAGAPGVTRQHEGGILNCGEDAAVAREYKHHAVQLVPALKQGEFRQQLRLPIKVARAGLCALLQQRFTLLRQLLCANARQIKQCKDTVLLFKCHVDLVLGGGGGGGGGGR